MCGVIVVDAGRSRSTWHRHDAYVHDHCLRYRHNYALSINCSTVICSPTVTFAILREATSETYGPWVSFPLYHISFPLYCISLNLVYYFAIFNFQSIQQKYLLYYLYYISLLRVTVKGLTTPLPRWLQGSWLFVQVLGDLCVVAYWIDTLVLKTEGNTYATLLHHPFLFKGKTNASSRGSID